MNTKYRQTKLLTDTLNYYNTHPIGYDYTEEACMYITPDKHKCAIGRLLTDEQAQEVQDLEASIPDMSINYVLKYKLLLSKPTKDRLTDLESIYTAYFLHRLQYIHDVYMSNNENTTDIVKITIKNFNLYKIR